MSYQSRKNSPARLLRELSWSDLNVTSTDFQLPDAVLQSAW